MVKLRLRIRNDIQLIEPIHNLVGKVLQLLLIPGDYCYQIELATCEILSNAMVHGNQNDPEREVSLDLDVIDEDIVIVVRDQGEGFDPGGVPDPRQPGNLLRASGRGIFLVKNYVDAFEVRSTDSAPFTNEVVMKIKRHQENDKSE